MDVIGKRHARPWVLNTVAHSITQRRALIGDDIAILSSDFRG